jgi:hypothetical protein
MRPTTFDQAYSKPLLAGNNPNTGDLPRCVATDPSTPGVCFSLSCWTPSPEELIEIVKTGKVYVAVMAGLHAPTQPPICIMGFNPIDRGDYKLVPEEDVKHLGGPRPPVL